jgi:hypothetical protein
MILAASLYTCHKQSRKTKKEKGRVSFIALLGGGGGRARGEDFNDSNIVRSSFFIFIPCEEKQD